MPSTKQRLIAEDWRKSDRRTASSSRSRGGRSAIGLLTELEIEGRCAILLLLYLVPFPHSFSCPRTGRINKTRGKLQLELSLIEFRRRFSSLTRYGAKLILARALNEFLWFPPGNLGDVAPRERAREKTGHPTERHNAAARNEESGVWEGRGC